MSIKITNDFIKDKIVFLGTSTLDGHPNVTVVDRPILLDDGRILIADVMMTSCKDNLLSNPNCSMIFFDFKKGTGLKIFGKGSYYTEGPVFRIAQNKLEGTGYIAKGSFAITVDKYIEVK